MPTTESVEGWVYPEDSGTNSEIAPGDTGDWNDAGNLAALFYGAGLHDYVVGGLEFSPDYANTQLTVSAGAAVCSMESVGTVDHQGDGGRGPVNRDEGASFIVHLESAVSGLGLGPSGVQHVYLAPEFTTDDALSIHIDSDATPPNAEALKIGEVNMDGNTYQHTNRDPPLTASLPQRANDVATKEYVDQTTGGRTRSQSATRSGDGTKTDFTFEHSLGASPDGINITPASEDASTDFWVSAATPSEVTITYAQAPVSGTNNLSYHILLSD